MHELDRASATLRALAILEVVANSKEPLTATQINTQLDLPKPTIHRLCNMLESQGFLQPRMDGRGYLPGSRLSSLAIGVFNNNDRWRRERLDIMQRLSDEFGETINISMPEGTEMVYFERVETHWPLHVQLNRNDKVPMYCTAGGKLYLNHLNINRRTRMIRKFEFHPFTSNTCLNATQLEQNLDKLRKQDFGVDNEEFVEGMCAIAVPIRDNDDHFYGALAVHAPSARLDLSEADNYLPKLRSAASEILELILED